MVETPNLKNEITTEGPSENLMPPVAPQSKLSLLLGSLASIYRENKWYVWAIVGAVVILSILSFFLFRSRPTTQVPAKVKVSIDAPNVTPSGKDFVYKITIKNNDSSSLTKQELELVYPAGVTFIDSTPKAANISGTAIAIPDLSPGLEVTVFLKVTMKGEINQEKQLLAKLHYKYSSFNSDFIADATHSVRISAADIALDWEAPSNISPQELVSLVLNYKNDSDKDVNDARIEVIYPDGFTYGDSDPKPALSRNVWNIGTLASQSSGQITIKGTFEKAIGGSSQTLIAKLSVFDGGAFITQAESPITLVIGSLPLVASVELQNNNSQVINSGDNLSYKVTYKNASSIAARGVSVVLTLDGQALDLSTIQTESGQVSGNNITWNAASIGDLEALAPSESGSFFVRVSVKNPPTRDSSKNLTIDASVKIKSDEFDTYLPGNKVSSKIATKVSVGTALDYSSGSLPPKVGTPTYYTVTISLTNTTNDLKDAIVTAFVPLGAGGFDSGSIGPAKEKPQVTYDASTGKLTWKLGSVTAHAGSFSPGRSISFKIKLTPSASQAGKEAILIRNITFSGSDVFTSKNISFNVEDVTTRDIGGDNYNDGIVSQ